ncbi:MAG: holo-ACP synthase, partial [Sphingomonadales bacterium]|nr:holo-ACP synthase [Sphingomonadales bacterium]
ITRIEKSLSRFGDRFIQKTFTEAEIEKSEARAGRAASYAKRFAAKEACAKALGTGIAKGVGWRHMGVVNMSNGQPALELTEGALKRLEEITPLGMTAQINLSITDDHPWAQAFVIISAVPNEMAAKLDIEME